MGDADDTQRTDSQPRVPNTYLGVDGPELRAALGESGLSLHHVRRIDFLDDHAARSVADIALLVERQSRGFHVCNELLPKAVLAALRTRMNLRDSQLHAAKLSAALDRDEVLAVVVGDDGVTRHFMLYVLRSEAPSDADKTFSESHPPEDLKTKLLQMVKGG